MDGAHPDPTCEALLGASFAADDEATLVLQAMAILPVAIGLLLGVPIVAREVELRTAGLAWSLSPSRRRWLLARVVPMVALLVAGLTISALTASWLADAREAAGQGRTLDDLGSYGVVMLTRGLMAFGIGLLAGAVVGRSLPAFLLAVVVMVAWGVAGAPVLRQAQIPGHLIWMTYDERDRQQLVAIAYDNASNGGEWYQAPDGHILTYREVETALCGVDPSADDLSQEAQHCLGDLEVPDTYKGIAHLVPKSALGDFQTVEAIAGAGLAIITVLLAFPVVARRRPS